MAREYGNIYTAIWRDKDFIALPAMEQRTYLMVITQPDISSCGILPFMPSRWAKYASDTDVSSLLDSLSILHHNRYLIVDSDTSELLVRSFIRYDKGYRNPKKRLPAILSAIDGMLSDTLRQVTLHELNRLSVPHDFVDDPIDSLSDSLLDSLWHTPRIQVVRNVSSYLNPETGIQKPETSTQKPETGSTSKTPDTFAAFWDIYPRKAARPKAEQAYVKALKRADAETILAGARQYRDDPGRDPQFTAHASTWLNQDRWNDGPLPAPGGAPSQRRIATADQRLIDGVSLAQRLAAEESSQPNRRQIGA